jgi:acetoin utilization deacetylase AcuC-like enzyme
MRVYTHAACLGHDPGPGHPECPARLQAVLDALRRRWPDADWRDAPLASRAQLARVAVLDFDVHHGNGTQDLAAGEPRLLYLSSHQSPLYPGTGLAGERGDGNLVNAPLPPGSGSASFRAAWAGHLLPALAAYAPELVLVSAGFDAHRLDPLADLQLETADYAWLGARVASAVAQTPARGRIVSLLEGGYSLTALAEGSVAWLEALAGAGGDAVA